MKKNLHAVEFDTTTFGMEIECDTEQYKEFKKSIQEENCINIFGEQMKSKVLTVPYRKLASIMRSAYWLVSEGKYFNKIIIDGLLNDEEIYVKYDTEPMDFTKRNCLN